MKPPFPSDTPAPGEPESWDAPDPSDNFPADPARIARFGLFIFLISLTSLFTASLLGYVMYRVYGEVPLHTMTMPRILEVSTALLLLAGIAMFFTAHGALHASTTSVRRWLGLAWLLSIGFVALQAPGVWLLAEHHHQQIEHISRGLYGCVLTLIVIHALHVIGGMVPLSVLTWRSARRPLTLSDRQAVRRCAVYWHFLETVWIVMYAAFLLLG